MASFLYLEGGSKEGKGEKKNKEGEGKVNLGTVYVVMMRQGPGVQEQMMEG